MSAKFYYDEEFGLRIEGEQGAELTEQQAMIVAVRDFSAGMTTLATALWDLAEEFRFKKFYDEDAQVVPRGLVMGAEVQKKKRSAKKGAS